MKSKNVVNNKSEMKKSIVIFYHRDPNNSHRGQGRYLSNIVKALSTRNNIEIIGGKTSIAFEKESTFINLLFNILNSHTNIIKFYLNFPKLNGKKKMNGLLIAEDIYIAPISILISKLLGVKMLYHAHDFGKVYRKEVSSHFRASKLIYAISILFERVAIRFSCYTIVPSLRLKEKLLQSTPWMNEERLLYFPYIAKPEAPDIANINQFKSAYNLEDKFPVVFIGPTDYLPNVTAINEIISLSNKIEDRCPQIIFIIGGIGTKHFEGEARRNLIFLGEVSDLDTLLYSCYVGLTPVKTPGGISIKTVDYLVHGLRVISTPEGAFGIPRNDQMIICRLSEFESALQELFKDFNNGHMTAIKVSKEVEEYFLSNLDEIIFLDKIDAILRKPSR